MQRAILPAVAGVCLGILVVACFGPALFHDQQFAYRDSAHFYYPLYKRVQQEWQAGRWPLWEPEENGGMPLLGNPAAAVLYPGKILYALPYAWGARLYVIAHVLLAWAAMLWLLRSWDVSWTGSILAAFAYAFGAPVLFQYCNVIFLVGAAWTPLGLRAVDRLLRLGRRWAFVELACVLAMQTLGGDPEAAYLVVLCGVLYALSLARATSRVSRPEQRAAGSRMRRSWLALGVIGVAATWVALVLAAAWWIKSNQWLAIWRDMPFFPSQQRVLLVGWACAGGWLLVRGRKRPAARRAAGTLAALAGAAGLGLGLCGAQLLPVLEFMRLSRRAVEAAPQDPYHFSLEPCRALEWVWPAFFGTQMHGNHNWLHIVPPAHATIFWVPSLYMGGLTLLLALCGAGFRGGPRWRAWLTAIALASFLGALGQFGSPIWWARTVPALVQILGPHDPPLYAPSRDDGGIADGDGSFYWLLVTVLPWFRTFRYPAKLLTFTSLALAALAGIGWDRWSQGKAKRAWYLAAALVAVSLGLLAVVFLFRDEILQLLSSEASRKFTTPLGPPDPQGALTALLRSLGQGALVMACGLALARAVSRKRAWAGVAALTVLAADLAVANASLVFSLPQARFDQKPRVLQLIEDAEEREPSPGPFRVHRMPPWNPIGWYKAPAADRLEQLLQWELDTLRPQFGLPFHVAYTVTQGPAELYDHWLIFSPISLLVDANRANLPGTASGHEIVYYPRRAFDLWNTRYFITPAYPAVWNDALRGFAAFLPQTQMIAPNSLLMQDPAFKKESNEWVLNQDWQLFRNKAAYPRAWVVHQARGMKPIKGLSAQDPNGPLDEILCANDPFWFDPNRQVFDPHAVAWLEVADVEAFASFLPGTAPDSNESAAITRYEPQRVEIEARLVRPGIVILADVYYPGWTLSLDGQPATILRVNGLMRGAAVGSGFHRLLFEYRPLSFRRGGLISLGSIAIALVLSLRAGRRKDPSPKEGP